MVGVTCSAVHVNALFVFYFRVVCIDSCILCCVVFFFQAEDGIRDLVRSRGLGDVYKRQDLYLEYAHDERQNKLIQEVKCQISGLQDCHISGLSLIHI